MSSEGKTPIHGFQINKGPSTDDNSSPNNAQKGHSTQSPTSKTSSHGATFSEVSSTPKSNLKVMEAGQEHTGRWTREEHEAFLQALQQYGKEWKKVAAKVKTRTVVQTRTHAQKYFQKLQKGLIGDKGDFELDNLAEAKKILPIANARKGRSGTKSLDSSLGVKKQQQAQHFSKTTNVPSVTSDQSFVTATQAAAELMTQLKGQMSGKDDKSSSNILVHSVNQLPRDDTHVLTGVFSSRGVREPVSENTTIMKITAPQPEQIMKRNMFPEPSPAACGKRKAAEIAVAQMLAGVATANDRMHIARQSTPPPEKDFKQLNSDMEPKHAFTGNAGKLQIINPDTLLSVEQSKRVRGNEPVTPWDSQLQALDNEVKGKTVSNETERHTTDEDDRHGILSERNALHIAVCNGSFEEVIKQLTVLSGGEFFTPNRSNQEIKRSLNSFDRFGFYPLHAAAVIQGEGGALALKMCRLLISCGADVSARDFYGNTAVHWAARVGNAKVIETLVYENCELDGPNDSGETPLHWAMRSGEIGMYASRYLLSNGARSSTLNKLFQSPLDVACEGFIGVCENMHPINRNDELDVKKLPLKELTEMKRRCRANIFSHSPQARTLILHHPECLEHLTKNDTDWESPDRVDAIVKSLLDTKNHYVRDYEIQISTEFERASLEFLSRVHSAEYLTFVNNLSKELEKRQREEENSKSKNMPPIIPFTPMVQRTVMREPSVKISSYSDTSFSSGSLRAARRAAGAVKHAVDCVLVGRNRNAFCITRPPGHHAGINGLLDGSESCGFCIFNNVAAGAMHALSDERHRPKCERCAIVDIDVHHGNGTEEIVKSCDHPGRLFFFSVHLYDNEDKKGKHNGFRFYPGTGDKDDVSHNIINVPLAPLWKRDSLLSRSLTPIPENHHNTRNKSKNQTPVVHGNDTESSTANEDKGSFREKQPAPLLRSSLDSSHAEMQPSFYYGTGREAYRRSIEQRLLPALRAFNPDLILLSVGFDACRGDVGNARHYKNGKKIQGIDLEPEDYAWTTRKIMEVADICCHGRIVSVLEGGYGSSDETISQNYLLNKSMISECAMSHLQALTDPKNVERRRTD